MKVALETLGCKLNQAETELTARQLIEAGHGLVSRVEEADIYVLNTCTVTHVADAKSRHRLRLAHRRNPNALIVAAGCYAQRVPRELAQIDGVGLVVSNDEKSHVLPRLQEKCCPGSLVATQKSPCVCHEPLSRTRSFVKAQDGCSNSCAYCIVPLERGREKSLPADQVVAEVRQRVAAGCQEVVLTGTEIGSYHYGGVGLKGLLERILSETGVARLRLSSLQPQEVSHDLLGLWRDQRLCPHFHLSLQSGSKSVLRRMKRGYSAEDYQEAVSLVRGLVPDVAITTDIIVGFPGETDREFAEGYDLCRELGFARIHVFPYSPRDGTEASQLSHQVDSHVKKERSRQMLALARESALKFRRQISGKVMPVLWEQKSADGVWSGLTGSYVRVHTRSDEDLTNRLRPVRLT